MPYLSMSKYLRLTIESNNQQNWWVHSLCTVNLDMRSQSGIYMTLGMGATYSGSYNQKLNSKISTEVKLVTIDDDMGQILWTRDFLAAQFRFVQTTTVSYWLKRARPPAARGGVIMIGISLRQTKSKGRIQSSILPYEGHSMRFRGHYLYECGKKSESACQYQY